jgi:hypothetical protein
MKKIFFLIIIIAVMNLFALSCDHSSNGKGSHDTGTEADDTSSGDGENGPGNSDDDDTGSIFPDVLDPHTVADLNTREDQDLGDVVVWNDNDYLYVKFSSSSTILTTVLAVESSLESIPQTGKGNPKPHRFEFKTWHKHGINEYTYKISIAEKNFETGSELYLAAHAFIRTDDEGEHGHKSHKKCLNFNIKSAWAEGYDFPGGCWGTYFTHRLNSRKYSVYYNGSLVAAFEFPVIADNRSVVGYYSYGYPLGASYNGDIIPGETDVIQTFIIRDKDDEDYLVVVLDKANDGSGGAADISLTSEGLVDKGLSFVVRDYSGGSNWSWADSLGSADIDFEWPECCTDGFVLGPLPRESNYILDLKFSSLDGLKSLKTHFSDENGIIKNIEASTDLLNDLRFVYVK